MSNNTLDLQITESYTLDSFEITAIRVSPHTSADVDITIYSSNLKIYSRTFSLIGDDYTAWDGDDYLYDYIQKNIASIFGA